MTPEQAAAVLGVNKQARPQEVTDAYRTLIRLHHPDRAGAASSQRASEITEAYRVLQESPLPPEVTINVAVMRLGSDAIGLGAPADEAFRWLLDAAHDVGEITYVDRSMPIMEVLCRFEGEPATSMVLTLQGRGSGTEVFATVESIESRPAPPTAAVVDLLELALHRRSSPAPPDDLT